MRHRITAFFLSASMLALSFGCSKAEETEEYKVTVKNLTGVEISEILIAPETDKSDYPNYLSDNLAVDGVIELTLGEYTPEDVSEGFSIQVVNAEDNSTGSFSMLMLKNGSTMSFYIDDWGLAVAVDMTDEEVEEQKQRDHEDYISATEAAEESTTTASAE